MGMEKVAWSGTTIVPETSINTTADWYNYSENRWANAINDESYFVWVPRYAYKIIYFDNNTNLNAYLADNSSTTGIIGYYTKDGKINASENQIIIPTEAGIKAPKTAGYTDYIVHPAFEDNVDLGGWDSELGGLWVAKYEMSMETSGVATNPTDSTAGNIATNATVKAVSKPGVESWRYINIANCYENSFNYDRAKESHLMKNSEWGAVAYLAHSKYGRNGVAISSNNVSSCITGGSTTESTVYGTNANMSTTGNAYGIYDLSGCAYEYVAGYNNEYSQTGDYFGGAGGNSDVTYKPEIGSHFAYSKYPNGDKYVTAYSNDSSTVENATSITDFNTGRNVSITGDGIKEVWKSGTTGWFSDYSNFVYSNRPFIVRGRFRWSKFECWCVLCGRSHPVIATPVSVSVW